MITTLFGLLLGVLVFCVGCIVMNFCFFLFDYTDVGVDLLDRMYELGLKDGREK